MSIAADDQEAFDAWRSAVEAGNAACSRTKHTSAAGWAGAALNRGTTPAERAHAVQQQEARKARLRATVKNLLQAQKKGWPDPREDDSDDPTIISVAQTRPSLTPRSPRASMPPGHALPPPPVAAPPVQAAQPAQTVPMARQPGATSAGATLTPALDGAEPPPNITLVPAREAPPVRITPSQAQPRPAPPAAPDPTIRVAPGEVGFRWASAERYRQDHKESLRYRGLFVPAQASGPTLAEHARLRVLLSLPWGEEVHCRGEVVSASPAGAGIQFEADSELARRLLPRD